MFLFKAPVLLPFALFATPIWAGQVRCDLELKSSVDSGLAQACLDIVDLQDGKNPIQVPGNTTRIDQNGFTLCKNAFKVETQGRADIVFVYDNSGSMMADAAYIDSNTRDTVFYYFNKSINGCQSNPVSGSLTFQTFSGPRTIPLLASNTDCQTTLSGDPYEARGAVIQAAIDNIASLSSGSTAGAVGFIDRTENPQPPLPLGDPANVARVKGRIILDTAGGTNYQPPLALAKSWLNDPGLRKTPRSAIVFISDGAPQDYSYRSLVDSSMPPIFSIFLSKETTKDTANLKELSDLTGGTFTRVNPGKVDDIRNVMQQIIRNLLVTVVPPSIVIANQSLAPPQVSKSISLVRNADSSIAVGLDSILALKEGENTLSVRIVLSDTTSRTYDLTVQADGPATTVSTPQVTCHDPARLELVASDGKPDTAYPLGTTLYTVQLIHATSDLSEVTVTATSRDSAKARGWGDSESIELPLRNSGPPATYSLDRYKVIGDDSLPIRGDGVLASDRSGRIFLSWTHPRDPRDTALYELPGIGPALLPPPLVTIEPVNPIARIKTLPALPDPAWTLVGQASLSDVATRPSGSCCAFHSGILPLEDSITHTGIRIEANGPFTVDAKVFSTLGVFVSRAGLQVPNSEFLKLPRGSADSSRVLGLVWDGRAADGEVAGTGAYILNVIVTLSDGGRRVGMSRIFGVLRQ